jgi:hypothetical protein
MGALHIDKAMRFGHEYPAIALGFIDREQDFHAGERTGSSHAVTND